jgi:hypothetical protein
MDRRRFLLTSLAGALAAPLAAEAQKAPKLPRIGTLSAFSPPSQPDWQQRSPFWGAMRELGWIERQNIMVERRCSEREMTWQAHEGLEIRGVPASNESSRLPFTIRRQTGRRG